MSVYRELGDAIVGEIISGEARKITKPIVISKTGRHRAKRIILRGNAICKIEKKLRLDESAM